MMVAFSLVFFKKFLITKGFFFLLSFFFETQFISFFLIILPFLKSLTPISIDYIKKEICEAITNDISFILEGHLTADVAKTVLHFSFLFFLLSNNILNLGLNLFIIRSSII